MKKLLEWLHPDHHGVLGSMFLFALWVAIVSGVLAVIVDGKVPEAAAFGAILGATWGITRGFGTRKQKSSAPAVEAEEESTSTRS